MSWDKSTSINRGRWAVALVFIAAMLAPAGAAAEGTPDISLSKKAPPTALLGGDSQVTLTASNPDGEEPGYNLTFRDVLPKGVEYVKGSAPVEPQVILDAPSEGLTTLIFENLVDLTGNSDYSLTYRVHPSAVVFEIDDTYTNEAAAYVNEDPRFIPKFDPETGEPIEESESYTGFAEAEATTQLTAVEILKSTKQTPEEEFLRGVHEHQKVYTLTVLNNEVKETTELAVDDYLPANLEFLGCGTEDHTTDAPTNAEPGAQEEEYPGSGPINPGNAPATTECPEPDLVETVELDPDGGGPLENGVYTHVRWEGLGALPAGGELEIEYVAAIPIRANTLEWTGTEPTPASLEQGSNLDNNSGPEAKDEQALTNFARVGGKYNGVQDVEASHELTRFAEDLAVQKSVAPSTIAEGQISTWTLQIETSEYRYAQNVKVTDIVPDGLCPMGEENFESPPQPKAECAPTGDEPLPQYSNVEELEGGAFKVEWEGGALAQIPPSGTVEIKYPTKTRSFYQETFEDEEPVLTHDSWHNDVSLAGNVFARCVEGDELCAEGKGKIFTEQVEGLEDVDASSAEQHAGGVSIDKKVRQAEGPLPVDCETGEYVDGPAPLYGPGDRVCWELVVDFPEKLYAGTPKVSDFLPPGHEYEEGSAVAVEGVNTVTTESFKHEGELLEWSLGPAVESGSRVFAWRFSTIVAKSPDTEPHDVEGNLMKFEYTNTSGQSFPERDQVEVERAEPVLALEKGVFKVDGEPPAGNPPNTDGLEVHGGDLVTYRLDLANTGSREAVGIELWDVLPAGIECTMVSGISDGGACNATEKRIEWTGLSVAAEGQHEPITYTVAIPTDVAPSQDYDNVSGVRQYESATNTEENFTYVPDQNIDPEVEAELGAPNADPVGDGSSVHTAAATLTKTRTTETTQEGNNGSDEATIGEVIDYKVVATVPEGSTIFGPAAVTDALGARQVLVPGSAKASLEGGELPIGVEVKESSVENSVTLEFPAEYVNPAGSGSDLFELEFKARVADVAANTRLGSALKNVAEFAYRDQTGTEQKTPPAEVSTTIVEPLIEVVKADDAGIDRSVEPGESVEYTLTVEDKNATRTSTANNVVVVDSVPPGMTAVNGGTPVSDGEAVGPDGGVYHDDLPDGPRIEWTIESLKPGESRLLHYDLQVNDPANAGSTFENKAVATTTSLPGSPEGERTVESASHVGYEAEATDTLGLIDATLSKEVSPTEGTIGEPLAYTLKLKLPPEIDYFDTTVEDVLGDGIDYDSTTSIECTSGCPPAIEGAELPQSDNANGSTTLGWYLGDIPASPVEREVTIVYQAHIDDRYEPEGTLVEAGQKIANTAQAYYDGEDVFSEPPTSIPPSTEFGGSSNEAGQEVEVLEPQLTIEKAVSEDTDGDGERLTQPGDSYTYTVTVKNEGSSAAYDVTVRDDNPDADLRNVVPTDGSAFLPSEWTQGDPLAWTIPGPIGVGESVVLRYTADLAPSAEIQDGDEILNTADIPVYWGLPKAQRESEGFDYREYTEDPEDSVELTVSLPDLNVVKTTGLSGNPDEGDAQIDQAFPWRVVISNEATDATAFGVDVADVLPANWTYVPDSAEFSPGGKQEPDTSTTPGGEQLSWEDVADIGPGDEVVLSFEATPSSEAATNPGSGEANPNLNGASAGAEDASGATEGGDGPYTGADGAEAILRVPALELEKKPDDGPATAGSAAAYEVVITNSGEAPATELLIVDVLGAGNEYEAEAATADPSTGFEEISAESGPGAGETTVEWKVASLGAGESVTITVPVKVPASQPNNSTLTNSASVTFKELPDEESDEGSLKVTRSADLEIKKTAGETTVDAGEEIDYNLHVENLGPSDAENVVVEDDVSPDLTIVSVDSDCSRSGQQVTCNVGSLAKGESRDYSLTVKVPSGATETVENTGTVTSTTSDPEPDNNESTEETPLTESADISIVKNGPELTVLQNTSFDYTLEVANSGPSDATEVTVTDELPTQVGFVEVQTTQGSCEAPAGTVECDLGTVAADGSVTITVTVLAEDWGEFENTGIVESPTPDPTESDHESSVETTVEPATDLWVEKTAPANVPAGEDLTYSLEVGNDGPADATGVEVTDPLPAGTEYVSAGEGCDELSPGIVTCAIGALEKDATATREITVHVPIALADDLLANTATVAGEQTDPNTPNDNGTAETQVGPVADLEIVKTMGAAQAGGKLTYTLVVSNHGPSDSSAARVHDSLPAEVQLESATPSRGSCSGGGGQVDCNLGPLAAGASAQVRIVVLVAAGAAGRTIRNQAMVEGSEPDPNPSNNTSGVEGVVQPAPPSAPDLHVVKTASTSRPELGVAFDYRVTVTNLGKLAATNVLVEDTLSGAARVRNVSIDRGSCKSRSGRITCRVPRIDPGARARITVRVVPIRPGMLANTAGAESSNGELEPNDNSDTKRVKAVALPTGYRLFKKPSRRVVPGGGKVAFRIVLRAGAHAVSSLRVCDRLPAALVFVRAPGARFHKGRACWKRPYVPPHGKVKLRLLARAVRSYDARRARNVARANARNAPAKAVKARVVKVKPAFGGRPGGVTG